MKVSFLLVLPLKKSRKIVAKDSLQRSCSFHDPVNDAKVVRTELSCPVYSISVASSLSADPYKWYSVAAGREN